MLAHVVSGLGRQTDGHSSPVPGRIGFTNERVTHAGLYEALVHEQQLGFVSDLEDDSVRVGRQVARARLACGVHELGGDHAER